MATELIKPVPHRRRLAFLFSIPLAFSLLFFAVTALAEHTDLKLTQLQELSSSIVRLRFSVTAIEAGERGFLLTKNERYLVPLKNAGSKVERQINICLSKAASQPSSLRNELSQVSILLRQRVSLAESIVNKSKLQGADAAVAIMESSNVDQLADQIRFLIDSLQRQLDEQESAHLQHQFKINHLAFAFFITGTLVVIGVTLWLYKACISFLEGRNALAIQLKDLNLNLESQVEERTRDLKAANEELQQFAYVASHDLQEPLRTVISFSQLLEARYKGKLDKDADEFIGYIVVSARRMTDLINGLLALARLRKTGQPTLPVSFDEMLSQSQMSLKAAICDSYATISSDPLPSLVVDKVQFLQVLQNLLSNAIKYRRDVPLNIRINAARNSTEWVFAIRDNGRGFDPQFAERVFGLFQRLHSREVSEGTGMGLAITRRIVERHGGRVWAESVAGEGSTFFFSLPVSLEVSRQEEAQPRVLAQAK